MLKITPRQPVTAYGRFSRFLNHRGHENGWKKTAQNEKDNRMLIVNRLRSKGITVYNNTIFSTADVVIINSRTRKSRISKLQIIRSTRLIVINQQVPIETIFRTDFRVQRNGCRREYRYWFEEQKVGLNGLFIYVSAFSLFFEYKQNIVAYLLSFLSGNLKLFSEHINTYEK